MRVLSPCHVLIPEAIPSQELQRSEDYVLRAETKFNINFEEGRSDDIQFMAHLWEPLRWIHKPLFVFLGAEMMWVATDALLYAQGFRVYKHQVHHMFTVTAMESRWMNKSVGGEGVSMRSELWQVV